jgi:hypothetical protein
VAGVDEVLEFCRRVLGDGAPASEAAHEAMSQGKASRLDQLAAAARACRARAEHAAEPPGEPPTTELSLAEAVAQELAIATAKLPERQREALAFRELLGLSHQQIAGAMEIEPAAVAPLLSRARLRLRAERRGGGPWGTECDERDRALRALARRLDSEPLTAEDDRWLLSHLAQCTGCSQAHAAMLEASVCYRAWRSATEEGAANGAAPAEALG